MPSNNPNWNTHQLREPVLALEVMFHIHSTQGECQRQIISGQSNEVELRSRAKDDRLVRGVKE
jgi:hypothetical protein